MSGETDANPSSWNPDLLKHHTDTQIDDLKSRLDERFTAQQRAIDAAHAGAEKAVDKALEAAEKAVDKALEAADKAVEKRTLQLDKEFHEHLEQQRHETNMAFLAADKAIDKALEAINKRLEGMNEFRAQLSTQAAAFMPREVADTQIGEITKQIAALTSRMDAMSALATQSQRNITVLLSVVGLIITAVVLFANGIFR